MTERRSTGIRKKEDQPLVDSVSYGQQLSVLENRFGIDLSASRSVPLSHVVEVRGFGHIVADWIGVKRFKSPQEVAALHEEIDSYLVLTPEDKRTLLSAQVREEINRLREIKESYISQGFWDQVSEEERKYFEALLSNYQSSLSSLLSDEVACATKFGYEDSDGNLVNTAVFVDWDEDLDPYSHCSLEGSVAEETFHLSANLRKLATQYLEINYDFIYQTEELAVKYYVVEALRALGIPDDKIDLYISMDPTCLDVWQGFIDDRGRKLADDIFFKGKASKKSMSALIWHRENEFREEPLGIIV